MNLQLTMFESTSPAVERLRTLEVEAMSPLEAINALFELKRLATDS